MHDLLNINLLNPELLSLNCVPYSKDDPSLSNSEIKNLLNKVSNWNIEPSSSHLETPCIYKDFKFKNYFQTIAFVNAVAWVAHQQDHHPEMTINYNTCHIEFTTHSINGLSLNDFICAAKINHV